MEIHTAATDDKQSIILKLYVSGMSARSMVAIENAKKLCDTCLHNKCELVIIDIYKNPELAPKQQIVFSPSLIKDFPLPKKILVGTLSDTERVINALGISKF